MLHDYLIQPVSPARRDIVASVTDDQLIVAIRFAIGNAKLTGSFRARVGNGTWFTLDNGSAFSIERLSDGWDIADVTSCL
jgi:hypothetical protein